MELWGETPLQVPLNTRLSELLHNLKQNTELEQMKHGAGHAGQVYH